MTPEQITLVETSMEHARSLLGEVAAGFYRRLFGGEPLLQDLFPKDLAEQQQKFVEELDAIVNAIRDCDAFTASAGELGLRHRAYGVRPRYYAVAGPALLDALAAALGERWTAEVEEAWRRAYSLTAEAMMAGAAEEPATRP